MNNEAFSYLVKDDYDSSYKIENKSLKCYSKKKFEEITKNKNVKVIGETLLRNKKKEISSIKLNSNTFIISKYKDHNSLFYKKAGYIEVKNGEYLCLLKFRAFIIWIIILGLLLGCFFGTREIISNRNKDRDSSIIAPDFDKTDVDDNQVPDKDADEEVKVVIPEGTVSSDLVVNTSDGKKYTGDANVNLYVTVEGGAKVLLSQKVKLNNGKLPDMKVDFTKLTFELKPGIYDGKFAITFDDGTKDEVKIKVIIVEKTGGTTGIGYSDKVKIDLNTGNISMKYKLGKSSHDVILQLILDKDGKEYLLSESGIIKPDSEITKMTLRNDMKSKLAKGTYKGRLRVNFKTSENGSTGMNTDIEVSITVS